MTQEEKSIKEYIRRDFYRSNKDLLLKDLCARQMNGVKCKVFNNAKPYILSGILHNKPYGQLYFDELDWKEFDGFVSVEDCKPYLFPLSSMTDEQDKEYALIQTRACKEGFLHTWNCATMMQWLIENHFDYQCLIEKGLAIDATGLNIY